jgi:WD40 repeat protein
MASLAKYYSSSLVGFFSYSRDDDTGFKDVLSRLRLTIQAELSAQLGRKADDFSIWQDKFAIPDGALWRNQISDGIKQAAFFIPIITPRVVNSPHCAFEFESFLAREAELGRDDLVFPILFIQVPELEDGTWQQNPVLKIVKDRQYLDWRENRYRPLETPEVAERIGRFCLNIANALRKPWVTPEERQQQQEAAARQKQAEQIKRNTAEIAVQQAFEEEKQRQAAEAARIAEEAKQREQERQAAQRRDAEQRQREEALARQRAEEARAFAMAKGVGTVAAFDVFLDAHGSGDLAGQAQKLREVLLARQQAHDQAMASDDFAVLRSFCKTYRNGGDVDEVRARMRALAPPTDWKSSRPAMAIAATVAFVLFVGVLAWSLHGSAPSNGQASGSTVPQSPSPKIAMGPGVQPPVPPNVTPPPPAQAPSSKIAAGPSAQPAPATNVTPALPPVTPVAQTTNSGTTASVPLPPVVKPSQPAVPAPDLSKWAFCQPNGSQRGEAMGGPDDPAPIKILLTKAQQDVMAVRTIAFSPNGKTLVTAGDDGIIRVWDAGTLKWVRAINADNAAIFSLAYSSDGSLLASASFDGTVQVWNANTFAHVQTFDTAPAGSGLAKVKQYSVSFEPASKAQFVYSTGADGNVWIWDLSRQALSSKTPSHVGNGDPTVGWLSFAPNGSKAYATANFDGTIRFFDSNPGTVTAYPSNALRLAYSPDGTLVASAGADTSGKSLGLKLWNSATHVLFRAFADHKGHVASVAWSPDGSLLASGGGFSDATVALWDAHSAAQSPLRSFKPNNKSAQNKDVEAVAFHPNKKWLVSGSEDGTMRIWDITSGNELLTVIGIPGGNDYVAYAPTGCYTGSANAANYVRFAAKEGDQSSADLLVPGDSTQLLLPQ